MRQQIKDFVCVNPLTSGCLPDLPQRPGHSCACVADMVKSVLIFGAETAVGLAVTKKLAAMRLGFQGESSSAVIARIQAVMPSLKCDAARALAQIEGVTPVAVPMDGHHTHALAHHTRRL